jgi:beta-phosphoglucomutase-like phosphatase (HAD superfamily)
MATRARPTSTRLRTRRVKTRPRPVPRAPRVDLDAVGAAWWSALDAADSALRACAPTLAKAEARELASRLTLERASTVRLLEDVARAERVGAGFSQLLVSRASLRRRLGLPTGVTACVFNLNGVLIGSAELHAAAWAEALDPFLLAHSERTGGLFAPYDRFAPFDPRTDYREHISAKPRLEGARSLLASRGISVPEGTPADPAGAETVHGLAKRKHEALMRRLERDGVKAVERSRHYLESARQAGMRCAVVSASASTEAILAHAGLAALVDERVDGATIVAERLRPRPAPDIVLAACRLLDVPPDRAAAFETSAAGVVAARAGLPVSSSASIRAGGRLFGRQAPISSSAGSPSCSSGPRNAAERARIRMRLGNSPARRGRLPTAGEGNLHSPTVPADELRSRLRRIPDASATPPASQ